MREAQDILGRGGKMDFLGHQVDAKFLHERLTQAVKLVEGKLGAVFGKLDLDRVRFEKLPANVVGEAFEGNIKIDEILLLHPASRLAAVLAHEFGHDGVPNEDLADAFVKVFFPNGVEGSAYTAERMENFAKDSKLEVLDLWKMYRRGEFRQIYQAYAEGVGDKGRAIKEMQALFPELTFTEVPLEKDGWSVRKPDLTGTPEGLTSKVRRMANQI